MTAVLNLVPVHPDEMMVLTTRGPLATKTHSLVDGEVVTGAYDDAANFTWRPEIVASVRDVHRVLAQLASDPKSLVIRGQILKPKKKVVNKRLHVGRDGGDPDWGPHDPGRRWVCFDFDGIEVEWSPDDPIPAVDAARAKLPPSFQRASCVCQFSASSGLRGFSTASVHLWFWLDRPVADRSIFDWAEGRIKDRSVFNAVQAHYVADPIFKDLEDPLRGARLLLVEGETDVVTAPPEWVDLPQYVRRQQVVRAEREASHPPEVDLDEGDPDARRRYAEKALELSSADIRDAHEGSRHETVVNVSFSIGGYVGSGYLEYATAEITIIAAARAALPEHRWASTEDTIREMLAIGISKPRSLKHVGRGVKWVSVNEKDEPYFVVENTEAMLAHYGVTARYNLMTHKEELVLRGYSGAAERRENAGIAQVGEWARRHGFSSDRILQDHVAMIVANNPHHPAAEWIASRPWDGVDRINPLFDSLVLRDPSQRALMLRLFTAWAATGARAAMVPSQATQGIASQLVLVLQGPGGKNKTRWIMSLVPPDCEWAREGMMIDPSNKDLVQQATSVWLGELGEIDATFKRADIAALKAFLTSRTDTYRAAYDRKAETVARRTVYAASVNDQNFLHDDTGNRRFAVVGVERCDPDHGVDVQQFWAQAAALPPSERYLTSAEEEELSKSNAEYEATNPVAELVALHWEKSDGEANTSLKSVLKGVDPQRNWSTADSFAASRALRNKMGARSRLCGGYRLFAVKPKKPS